jgi:hypothetical protein
LSTATAATVRAPCNNRGPLSENSESFSESARLW